ncbi:MAG: GrpB family protein [Betaproteobacteria bacterium]
MFAELAASTPARPPAGSALPAAALTLSPYQPSWPARFRVEAEVLRVALAVLTPVIEHCGSTAVPHLAARPVIDVLVGLPMPKLVDPLAGRLANFGYVLMGTTAQPYAEPYAPRMLTRQVRGLVTHHVQVVESHGDAWHRILLFRDLLRADAALAHQYAAVKFDLLRARPGDAVAYANGKSSFIDSILGR